MSEELAALQDQTFARSRPATSDSFAPATRLTASQLAAYLDRRAFAVVATTRPDGRPHAAMTSFVRDDATFWLPTVAGSVRGRNVQDRGWACLVVAEGDHDAHVMVSIEGPTALLAPAEVPPAVRGRIDGDWVDCWIRLDARRVLSYAAVGALD